LWLIETNVFQLPQIHKHFIVACKLTGRPLMTGTTKYYGTYSDAFGTAAIVIENDFENLSAEIGGVKFMGCELSSMSIIDKSNYSEEQLERFTLWSIPIYNTNIAEECLCNCLFKFTISQRIIDKTTNIESVNALTIECALGKERPMPKSGLEFEKVRLCLSIGQFEFEGTGDFFEIAFDEIKKQLDNKYCFKNCYGCMFGDYSVYGQSSFGTMLCFVSQKEKYKDVTNKQEYMELTTDETANVQEIYCCDKYEIRKVGAGYRG
jgi:hypothetical protein